jgi:hypothetical protein
MVVPRWGLISHIDRIHDHTDFRALQIKIRRKKNVKKGIQFCLMVCGASGTGTRDLIHVSIKFIINSLQGGLPL